MSRRLAAPVLLLSATVLIAGCGSGATTLLQHHAAPGRHRAAATDAAQVQVIREWAAALQRGDMQVAASYFALPSVFANGFEVNGQPAAVTVHTENEAVEVNESLSCGAKLISTQQHGKYIIATFRLTNRAGPGAGCGSGAGASAATDFVITRGHITEWLRAPVGPASTTPTVTAPPANNSGPGAQV